MADTVDLEPGDYWLTSSGDGKGRAIVTYERRLLVEQFPDDDGSVLWSDLTDVYTGGWAMERRTPLDDIERWREFAGPTDYGHPPLDECDQPCEACMHDARVAVVVNRILDGLAAQRKRADDAEAWVAHIQKVVCG